jgi:hypothetical protein
MLVATGIDLGGRSEEALAIANLDNFIVADLFIRAAWDDFEQIAVWADGSGGHMAQLLAGHVPLRDGVLHPVDLDVEFQVVLGVMLPVFLMLGFWCFVGTSLAGITVSVYQRAVVLDKRDVVVHD